MVLKKEKIEEYRKKLEHSVSLLGLSYQFYNGYVTQYISSITDAAGLAYHCGHPPYLNEFSCKTIPCIEAQQGLDAAET